MLKSLVLKISTTGVQQELLLQTKKWNSDNINNNCENKEDWTITSTKIIRIENVFFTMSTSKKLKQQFIVDKNKEIPQFFSLEKKINKTFIIGQNSTLH